MSGLIVSGDGFEDSELTYPLYRLGEAGFAVDVATPNGDSIESKHGQSQEADLPIEEVEADDYGFLVVPGGRAPESMRLDAPETADLIAAFEESGRPIASICHGAQLLISADVIDGRTMTAYWSLEVDVENAGATFRDEPVVVDDNLVTSRDPDDLPAFMTEFLDLLDEQSPGGKFE
jgi:protease I